MADIDLTTYINDDTTVSTDKLQDVAYRIRTLLTKEYNNLAVSPDSVFGSLFVAPAANAIALLEDAASCMLSDIDLNNALNGLVCDCDFLESYLKGLGVVFLANANTVGVIRLLFNSDILTKFEDDVDYIEIDAGQVMMFKDTYIFNFLTAYSTPLRIYKSDKADAYITAKNNNDTNCYILNKLISTTPTDTTDFDKETNYFVDMLIYGPSTASVDSATAAKLDVSLVESDMFADTLISATAVTDITPFDTPTTIAELLTLTRQVQPTANFATKANIISLVYQKFPSIQGCSVVMPSDDENKIKGKTVLNTAAPSVDIYVKGYTDLPQVTEAIDCTNNDTIALQHIPIKFDNTTHIEQDCTLYPTTTAINYMQNNVYIKVTSDKPYVTYYFDPIAEALDMFVKSPGCTPAIYTKVAPTIPIELEYLNIKYSTDTGTYFDRQSATDSIYELVNGVVYPDNDFELYITDILLTAGARNVYSIESNGTSWYIDETNKLKQVTSYNNTDKFKTDSDVGAFGFGARSASFIIDRGNINLIKV